MRVELGGDSAYVRTIGILFHQAAVVIEDDAAKSLRVSLSIVHGEVNLVGPDHVQDRDQDLKIVDESRT